LTPLLIPTIPMPPPCGLMPIRTGLARRVLGSLLLLGSGLVQSQTLCSSDGQAPPTALIERFISAECASCWQMPLAGQQAAQAVPLDWIVPSHRGDDAPLSVVANTDARIRLEALAQPTPQGQSQVVHPVKGWPGASLRVARGLATGGYVGASITLRIPKPEKPKLPLYAWLALVEALPIGIEASPVPRNLIRNVLQPIWDGHSMLQESDYFQWQELRPMNIPSAMQTDRMQVVGWVTDATGGVLLAAASVCHPEHDG
jgi:hypothetical protein